MSPEKRASAEFLVEQIRMVQSENATLLDDNMKIALQVENLRLENEKLNKEVRLLQIAADGAQRIEELEDLVFELKSNSSP